jgi:hypothetical protein
METGFPRLVRKIEILHSEGEGDSIAYRKLWIAMLEGDSRAGIKDRDSS